MLDLHALDIRHGDRAEAVRVTLSEHIRSGALAPGARLPATRQLAAQLGVTRTDVLAAYAHLTDGGLIEGRGRLGTYVSCAPPDAAVSPGPAAQPADIALLDRLPHTHPLDGGEFGHLNWRIGGAAARLLDLAAWRQACREVGRHGPPPGWGDARGAPPLRAALLDYLRQVLALPVAPEQIVITRGSADALGVLAQALLRRGDVCAVEDPGHPSAARAFSQAGAVVMPLPVDGDGAVVDALEAAAVPPVLVHVTPAHQFPCGVQLSASRRRQLVAWARRAGGLLIENDYGVEFDDEGASLPRLYAAAPERTVLLGTFATVTSPSLRISYAVAPPAVAQAMARVVREENRHVSWPAQSIVTSLLTSQALDRHIARSRGHGRALRAKIRTRLVQYGDLVSLQGAHGGLHVVIHPRVAADEHALCKLLAERGVAFSTVADYGSGGACPQGIILAFGHMDEAMLDQALALLDAALATLRRSRP